ncbi:BTAD domain-containing putative transcriptional regulator [Aquihabitans daechungensis]|uniref:BTAD domain-containing putative transcriptional regulator n=1 Tax=Aquihabitans daechungensis TaxID=1052257 RepID=UPI003BA282DC
MQFGVLGPLEILDHAGERVEVGGPQPRLVLALLIAAAGRAVRTDALIDALWGEVPPASASGTLQSYVSRLRRAFDGDDVAVVYADGSYRLDAALDQVDAWRFEALAEEGRNHLEAGAYDAARTACSAAEALWRGPALAEFADHEVARNLAVRLDERRIEAVEHRFAAELALGRHGAVVGELIQLVAAHPLREGLQVQLALALYRSGRQADALRAIADAGRHLREELGIEPSRALRDLEAAILDHDPALDPPAAASPSGVPAPSAGPSAPGGPEVVRLAGRDAELRQLRAALEESRADARFVVLEGEAGIGKTRLADELRAVAQAQGSRVIWGRSDEGGAAPSLWPWLSPLRALVADPEPVSEPIAALLSGDLEVLPGQGPVVRYELFEAIAALIERAGAVQPVVLLLDDLQWADGASLELLEFLAGRLGSGVLVVATMRRLEVGQHGAVTDALAALARRRGSRRLLIRGLRPDDTAELLDDLDPDVVTAIHHRAEGNPFYAIELARLVTDDGLLPDDVPGSVGDVVRRRLAGLPAATADVLGVAAVQGREIDLGLLAATTGTDLATCLDTIEPAVVQRLLEDDADRLGGLRFSHALVRDVILDGLTSLRRARLHLAVADALVARGGAGPDVAEILAEHLWQAAPVGVGSRAADALEQAAEVAVSRVSYLAAEDLLTRAVRLRQALGTGPAEQRAELEALVRLLEITQITRYFQGADHGLVQRAIDLAVELGDVETHRRLAWYQWAAGATAARVDEGLPLAEAYRQRFKDDPRPFVQSSAHEVYAVGMWGAGRIGDAVRSLDVAFDLLDGVPPPEDTFSAEQYVVSFTFWLYNHALHGSLTVDETARLYQQLHDQVPDPVGRASVCGFAMTTFAPLLEWQVVDRFETLALEADPRSQYGFWGGQLQMHRGILAAWKGRVDDGLELFADGRARYMGIGGCSGMHSFEACMALLMAQQGRVAEGRVAADAARSFIDTRNERWAEPLVCLAEAAVLVNEGDEDAAVAKVVEARAVALRQEAFAMLPRITQVADELGLPRTS